MRALALAIVLAAAGPVVADPAPAKPEPAKAEAAKPTPAKCKMVVVGRGLERHSVCQIDVPIVVKPEAARPGVVIVQVGGKRVVGPPRVTDPFAGLSHSLRD